MKTKAGERAGGELQHEPANQTNGKKKKILTQVLGPPPKLQHGRSQDSGPGLAAQSPFEICATVGECAEICVPLKKKKQRKK